MLPILATFFIFTIKGLVFLNYLMHDHKVLLSE